MKKPTAQIMAIAIGFASAIAIFNYLKKFDATNRPTDQETVIGEIQSVSGQVERRIPHSVTMETVPNPKPLHNQELLITQKNSSAVIILNNGTTLKLKENTRFIVETDAIKPGALIGTLLDGGLQVLNPGTKPLFKLVRDGHEISIDLLETSLIPTIPQESAQMGAANAAAPAETPPSGLIITATVAEEKPAVAQKTPLPVQGLQTSGDQTSDVLTNDDIIRQLKSQMSYFQRCYLNFIHRQTGTASTQGGKVTVSFVIQGTGKVSDARLVRSDFSDTTLHNCINEVISRTVFKGFKGTPVPVLEFPIILQ